MDVLQPKTYLPDIGPELERLHDFIEAHEQARRGGSPRYFLAGAEPGKRVEVPLTVHKLIRQVVTAFRQGHAVTVTPIVPTLTVQQAADLLDVSRPAVIRLLDEGTVPYEQVGTQRRVPLRDLLAHRERSRTATQEDPASA